MARPGHDHVVLLTGFPTFFARKMLARLLSAEPHAFVYTFAPSPLSAIARESLDALSATQRVRVALFEGHAAAMDFGLSGAEFRQLTREVDLIYHFASCDDPAVERKTAELLNLVSTAEVLEFAGACASLECLLFCSTAHVAGDRTGVVYEHDLDCGQSFRNDIEQTRFRAELLAQRAISRLPIVVVRPTTIVDDSMTGNLDWLDAFSLLTLIIIASPSDMAIPLLGRDDVPLNIVPATFVTRACHCIAQTRLALGRTFHLVDPRPLSVRRAFEIFARVGGHHVPKGYIPSTMARLLLRAPGLERFTRSPKAFMEQLLTPVHFNAKNTEQILEGTGIECPPFESYAEQLVGAVHEHIRQKHQQPQMEPTDPLS